MTEPKEITEGLWTFPIPLPNSPLKWLNCYVIKGKSGERNLLVDTGFDLPECREALLFGMQSLELRLEETDVFLTHFHSDHSGNAPLLESLGCRIFMSREDGELFTSRKQDNSSGANRMSAEGISRRKVFETFKRDPVIVHTGETFCPILLDDGDIMTYGAYNFEGVLTPGHTPGHMCLYDPSKKVMLLGDHVLFGISPNICVWKESVDMLGLYMESLRKIMEYDVLYALPGHRNLPNIGLKERVAQLIEHHEERLSEVLCAVKEHPGLTAYEIAGKITWHVHSGSWHSFPMTQKYFAFNETLAHLDCLCNRGFVIRKKHLRYNKYYEK